MSETSSLGEVVRTYRNKTGLTQGDIANELKVSQAYAHQIETDQVSLSAVKLARLAKLLKLDYSELLLNAAETTRRLKVTYYENQAEVWQ